MIASLDEEKKKELQDYIAHRTREMDARVKKIDNQIKNNDKAIQKVRDELNVALNQIPLDKKQVQRLNNKLLQLEKQKDDLREEKESLANKMHDFLDVQKKILEARAHNPLQDSIFNAPEFIDKEKDFLHRWADLK